MKQKIEILLWIVTALLVIISIVTWSSVAARYSRQPVAPQEGDTTGAAFNEAQLARAADSVVTFDPFRLERKPSSVAFGTPVLPQEGSAAMVSRAQLILKGTVGGPPWQAIMSGIPGKDGNVVLAQGDTVAGYKIKRIKRDTAIVQGDDSTMTLTVRQGWQ